MEPQLDYDENGNLDIYLQRTYIATVDYEDEENPELINVNYTLTGAEIQSVLTDVEHELDEEVNLADQADDLLEQR